MNARLFLGLLIVGLFTVQRGAAQWNADPAVRNVITAADSAQRYASMCPDGRGGAFVAWEDQHIDTLHVYVYVQHVNDIGVNQWNGRGLPVSTCIEDFQHKPKLCNDGAGGAIVAFYNDSGPRNIMAQRVDSNGTMLWGCAGITINTISPVSELIGLFSDRNGGAYLVWTQNNYNTTPMPTFKAFVTRINAAGAPVWSSPAQIYSYQGNYFRGTAGVDTLGNVFYGWMGYIGLTGASRFHCNKITPNGVVLWGTGATPDTIAGGAGAIVGDNLGGAFTATCDGSVQGNTALEHIAVNGSISWRTKFQSTPYTYNVAIVSDGYGGAIGAVTTHVNQQNDKLGIQRVDITGGPLWGADGLTIVDGGGAGIGQYTMVNDGRGGAIVGWQQAKLLSQMYSTHIDSSGKLFWGNAGKVVCNTRNNRIGIYGGRDFPEQMLCVWVDYRDTATRADIYATKLGDPWLAALDTVIDFGKVNVGDTVHISKPACLRNIGPEDLTISQDQLTGVNRKEFNIDNDTSGLTLVYRSTRDVDVAFLPASSGAKSAAITYTCNSKFGVPTIHLLGRGVQPGIRTTPRVDFGNQPVGQQRDSVIARVVLSSGSGFLHVDSIRITGASNSFLFDSGNVAPVILDSGKTLTFKIGFKPAKSGRIIDSIYVYTNVSQPGFVQLLGTGTKGSLQLQASDIDFGDVMVGTPRDSIMNAFGHNAGQSPVQILSRVITGTDASQFTLTQATTPHAVTAGRYDSVTAQFLPTGAGIKTAMLDIITDVPETLHVTLHGNGITQAARHAVLALAESQVDMGDTLVGSKVDSILTAVVHNSGDTALLVSQMSIIGANASEFAVDDSLLPFSVDPSSTKTLTVHFLPASAGNKTAQLTFMSNSAANPSVTLTGRAHTAQGRGVLTVASNQINCGNSSVGTPVTAQRPAFIRNAGTAPFMVTALKVGGVNASDFVSGGFAIRSLAPGDTMGVSVTFTPTASGARTATMTVKTDIGDSSVVQLLGNGTVSKLTLSAVAIDFGSVAVGSPRDTTITAFIANTGTVSASVTAIDLRGADAASFSNPSTAVPITIAAGATAPVTLRFLPTRTGIHNATVVLINGNDTLTAALTGRGVRQVHLSIAGGHGTPGTMLSLPVTLDAPLNATSVRGVDITVVCTEKEFYLTGVQLGGTAIANWTAAPISVSGDTTVIHLSGTQSPAAMALLCNVQGLVLQSNVTHAPIAIASAAPAGDLDVTMAAGTGFANEIVMDTTCGYGVRTFSVRGGPLILWQPVPNPASSGVVMHYRIESSSDVHADVHDGQGRVVWSSNSAQTAGDHDLTVDTRMLPPGVYVCVVTSGAQTVTERFVVAR